MLRQFAEPDNYRALARMTLTAREPLDFAGRYFLGRGAYPARCAVRTRAGVIEPWVYTHHDVITINEIFCRLDYRLPQGARTVLDVGSNIGISALYFLTASPLTRCFLYEPDPRNVERLQRNLAPYEARYSLTEAAVADYAGRVSFGREPTGIDATAFAFIAGTLCPIFIAEVRSAAERHDNLRAYVGRMTARYYPDRRELAGCIAAE